MFTRLFSVMVAAVAVAVVFGSASTVSADCADAPLDPLCANFTLNSTEVNLNISLIEAVNQNYTGILAHDLCHHTTNPDVSGDVKCRHFSHFRLVCKEAGAAPYCGRLFSMCQEGTQVLACARPWLDIPTFFDLQEPLITMCDNSSSPVYNSEGCGLCQLNGAYSYECPHFDAWAEACQNASDPTMTPGCETWVDLCVNSSNHVAPYSNWDFCGYVRPNQAPVSPNATCLENPLSHSCHQYMLATVEDDIADLCGMMPNMPGCALNQLCATNATINATSYCQNRFAILKTLCVDMPGMGGCANYNQMCQNGTQVEQCGTLVPTLPATMFLSTTVQAFCAGATADIQPICATCPTTSTCNLIATYSGICQRNSADSRCAAWATACASPGLSTWAWCQPYTAAVPSTQTVAPGTTAPVKPATPTLSVPKASSAVSVLFNASLLVVALFVAVVAL